MIQCAAFHHDVAPVQYKLENIRLHLALSVRKSLPAQFGNGSPSHSHASIRHPLTTIWPHIIALLARTYLQNISVAICTTESPTPRRHYAQLQLTSSCHHRVVLNTTEYNETHPPSNLSVASRPSAPYISRPSRTRLLVLRASLKNRVPLSTWSATAPPSPFPSSANASSHSCPTGQTSLPGTSTSPNPLSPQASNRAPAARVPDMTASFPTTR